MMLRIIRPAGFDSGPVPGPSLRTSPVFRARQLHLEHRLERQGLCLGKVGALDPSALRQTQGRPEQRRGAARCACSGSWTIAWEGRKWPANRSSRGSVRSMRSASEGWCARQDSNLWPSAPEALAHGLNHCRINHLPVLPREPATRSRALGLTVNACWTAALKRGSTTTVV
jgi:hypothetical protein